jgi:hypothetical protein
VDIRFKKPLPFLAFAVEPRNVLFIAATPLSRPTLKFLGLTVNKSLCYHLRQSHSASSDQELPKILRKKAGLQESINSAPLELNCFETGSSSRVGLVEDNLCGCQNPIFAFASASFFQEFNAPVLYQPVLPAPVNPFPQLTSD